MKLNSTVLLTLAILVMMVSAGSASAYIGYLMGSQALRGVTQPDINSTKKLNKKKQIEEGSYKGLKIIDEKEILVKVYNRINGQEKKAKEQSWQPQDKFLKSNQQQEPIKSVSLPIRDTAQGVTLEVLETQRQGNSLLLDINLKNEGQEAVRFLYSFLDVRDDRGRILSAIADNLPGELPANGKTFAGTLRIPTVLLDNAENISVTLTDYPAQKLELKLDQIPVTR
jgi:hypothetical protein